MSVFVDGHAPLGFPYWWEGAPPRPDLPNILPQKTDLLVIGAGYTGLSAAIAAHDAGATVVVVDKGWPGTGASTRNGGMFGAHPRLPVSKLKAMFGEATATGVLQESLDAFTFTRDLIAQERIDCDLQMTGRVSLAWTKAHHDGQKQLAADVSDANGGRMEVIAKKALANEISTEQYHGGVLFPDHAALHPRKFHDGLIAAVVRRGVAVVPDTAVLGLQTLARGHLVETSRGVIRADNVVAATNGYVNNALPKLRARVFPLPSFLIATEPLSPNLIADLAPGRRMMVETRARHSYFRVSPDGARILFGGRASMRPLPLDRAAKRLHQTMSEIWPVLGSTKITHAWTGNTGYSFTHMPHVGTMDGIHYAMGYSGSGVAMAPYLGMKAAYRALGDARGATAFAETPLQTRPFHLGKPWFLYAADLWYRYVVDPSENAAAARDIEN